MKRIGLVTRECGWTGGFLAWLGEETGEEAGLSGRLCGRVEGASGPPGNGATAGCDRTRAATRGTVAVVHTDGRLEREVRNGVR